MTGDSLLVRSALWRRPLHKHRCLVPISGFYEWRRSDRKPFRLTFEHQPFYALAGLWDAWKSPSVGDHGEALWLQSMSIITVAANPTMRPYHDRMPAILHPHEYAAWLDRDETSEPLRTCFAPSMDRASLSTKPMRKFGNVRNQGAEMLIGV